MEDRLFVIERDIKKLIAITSALQSDKSRIERLEVDQKNLIDSKNKILGAISLLYFLLTFLGLNFFKKLFL